MTKIEQLAEAAIALPDDQIDGLIAYARYLVSEPLYYSAPPEALTSIRQGLAEYEAGNSMPADDVFYRIRKKIESTRP